MRKFIRSHLAWKVFLSYLAVVLVGVLVLITAARLSLPVAYSRQMERMSAMMSGDGMMSGAQPLPPEQFSNYQAVATDALSLAILAALVVAVLASFLISRQVVGPVQRMQVISRHIAEGHFKERLSISGNVRLNQLDELDQLALSFNQMADNLEKTETVRRQLIADISHELRTPLAAMKGYMEGLMDNVLPASPETYQLVHSEADRLERLVNSLQELSRVEAGAYKLQLDWISLAELVDKVVMNLKRQFEAKDINIDIKLDDNLPSVYVDKDRILQVLTNLVGNALQYTPAGGSVTLAAERTKQELVVSVIDTGIGISPEHMPFIFNRFYRTDKSRARASGGSGIGLTIAQALVQAHHGRIWAESAGEGKGSIFRFTLPLSKTNKSIPQSDHHQIFTLPLLALHSLLV